MGMLRKLESPGARRVALLFLLWVCCCPWVTGCSREAGSADSRPRSEAREQIFVDVAAEAGLSHRHHKPTLDPKLDNIMSWMASVGAAVAAADYDSDGWVDLFFTESKKGEPNRLYRNRGDGTFEEVAARAGLADANDQRGTSMDAVWGDVDNDGDPDLYLVRWGFDSLYLNRGDGTFEDVTGRSFQRRDGAPGVDWANGNAAIFFDFDLDGRLDIYVGNYFQDVDLWDLRDTRIMHDDFERSRNGGANFLYRQRADGTFVDVAADLGVDDPGWTLAVGSADVDADGFPDLYCANDFGPDQLFLGSAGGQLINVTESALGFDTKKGMNVDFGDFNNDGWMDIYVTNITTAEYLQEGNMLWLNQGPQGESGELRLTDISLEAGTYDGGWGWGAKFFDYDNDGDLDVVSANGFISAGEESYWYDLASWTVVGEDSTDASLWPAIGDRSFSGYELLRLWRNDGLDSFTERATSIGLESDRDGRGIAVLDYDNDGDLDLALANQDQAPHLFRNQGVPGTHWLGIVLETDPRTGVNRDAIGTRVSMLADERLLVRERDGGNGFSGQSDPRLHFGLGRSREAALVEVRWPDGGVQYLEGVPAGQWLTVRQDPAVYASERMIELGSPSRQPGGSGGPRKDSPSEVSPVDLATLGHRLDELEDELSRAASFDRALASLYRRTAAEADAHDRAISFLEEAADQSSSQDLRLELSLAYVDKIPACGGLAAIVCKGSLAKKGLDAVDRVLQEHPDSWLALYARGMNHLHWPRALRHSEDAVEDFRRCVELQSAGGVALPYHQRAFLALGQAHAKAGDIAAARGAWLAGLELFPEDPELKAHLEVEGEEELLELVLAERSLESALDTDLSFFPGPLIANF